MMEVPRYYEVKPGNVLDPLDAEKMSANESCLLTIKHRESGNYYRYVFEIFDFRITEDADLATITLPFALPFKVPGQVDFGLTLSDDPFMTDAAGMGSLGYSFIKVLFIDCAIIVSQGETYIQGFILNKKRILTIPER